jgi:hypothetical protein
MKKTNSVSVLAVIITTTAIVGILSVTQQTVYTEGAYTRGYNDAVCDASNCHGYGYDPSCPSRHSGDYCSNYGSGYAAGWNSASGSNSGDNSQS